MGFYEDAKPEQQQLLSIAQDRVREIVVTSPPDFWQGLVDEFGSEPVLAWAKGLAQQEKARLDGAVAEAQERVDALAAVLAERAEAI